MSLNRKKTWGLSILLDDIVRIYERNKIQFIGYTCNNIAYTLLNPKMSLVVKTTFAELLTLNIQRY